MLILIGREKKKLNLTSLTGTITQKLLKQKQHIKDGAIFLVVISETKTPKQQRSRMNLWKPCWKNTGTSLMNPETCLLLRPLIMQSPWLKEEFKWIYAPTGTLTIRRMRLERQIQKMLEGPLIQSLLLSFKVYNEMFVFFLVCLLS